MSNWQNHQHSTRDEHVRLGVRQRHRRKITEKLKQSEKQKERQREKQRTSRLRVCSCVWLHRHISSIHANQCGCQHLRHGHNGPFMLTYARRSSWSLQGNNYWTYPANMQCLWLQKLPAPTFKWQRANNTGRSNAYCSSASTSTCAHTHSFPFHWLLFWIPFCQLSEHG